MNGPAEALGHAAPMTGDALRAEVRALLDEPVGDHDNLLDAGLDSIRLMTVVEWLRAAGHAASFEDLAEEATLAAWVARLEAGA
jgi:bifunctional isochorismate lyase/aryl carrier protein